MGCRSAVAGLRTDVREMVARDSMSSPAIPPQQRWQNRQRCSREAGVPAVLLPLLLLCCIGAGHASVGDRDPAFQWCVGICAEGDGCVMLPPALKHASVECTAACPAQFDHPVPAAVRALRWSCEDDCKYRCMQARESVRREQHAADAALPATVKYYGKWPFTRVLGMQEVASVLFSLANLAAHAHCLLRFLALLRRLAKSGSNRSRVDVSEPIYMTGRGQLSSDGGYSLGRPGSPQRTAGAKQTANLRGSGGSSSGGEPRGSVGAGSSSTTNASRLGISPISSGPDNTILSGSGSGGHRSGVRKRVQALNAAYPFWPLWLAYAGIAIAAWTASVAFHVRDVKATERTDYLLADALILYGFLVTVARTLGWTRWRQWALLAAVGGAAFAYHAHHMLHVLFDYGLNVTICVVVGLAQTITWAAWAFRVRHPCRTQLYTFLLLLNAATALEVFDFPPWLGLLDAHALWHATTVPLTYRFWAFVNGDTQWSADRTAAATAAQA